MFYKIKSWDLNWEELVTGLLICALGLITYFFIIDSEVYIPIRHTDSGFSPALLPKCASIVLAVLGFLLLINTFFSKHCKITSKIYWKEIFTIGFAIAYTYLIEALGYLFGTSIILIFFFILLGVRNWKILFLVSVTIPISIYFFFTRLMRVSLPGGLFF